MSKSSHIPYSWEEIEEQVRDAILCQLSILQCLGPDADKLGEHYLGIDPDALETLDRDLAPDDYAETLRAIPLERHHLHHLVRSAYAYAYQLFGCERTTPEDHYEIVCAVMEGFPQTDRHGNPSPLSSINDFPLRRVLETFLARWKLSDAEIGEGLTVRELALLSSMTVPAVRSSLSKEGFKLETPLPRGEAGRRDDDRGATLNVDDALLWLSRRRSFIPNSRQKVEAPEAIIAKLFEDTEQPFDHVLRQAMIALRIDHATMAAEVMTPVEWVDGLARGAAVEINVAALRSIARRLKLPEPDFVARAVQHLVRLDLGKEADTPE